LHFSYQKLPALKKPHIRISGLFSFSTHALWEKNRRYLQLAMEKNGIVLDQVRKLRNEKTL
jgi:hypothetical protein